MSDITLDNLNSLDSKINDFGTKFCHLLEKIRDHVSGKNLTVNEKDFDNLLDEIINNMQTLKDEMHRRVEEVYKENTGRFTHLTKLQNDLQEQYNSLSELKIKIKSGGFVLY